MREIKVMSLMLDPGTGLFDDGPLRAYLAGRELLRVEPSFFVHQGTPGRWLANCTTTTISGGR